MIWYFPSFAGDFRLVPAPESPAKGSLLVLEKATLGEQEQLRRFLLKAAKKGWVEFNSKVVGDLDLSIDRQIQLAAPVEAAGGLMLKILKPKPDTLTAVKFKDGRLEVEAGSSTESFTALVKASVGDNPPRAAVTVSRPTPCCPRCLPGAVERASEVLLEFLSPSQHEDWARHRSIIVEGGLSGHRYLLKHRHHPAAVRDRRICRDLDSDIVLHFHDWSVPPEEEVLAAKLVLEHAEHWLRNRATMHDRYHEPQSMPCFGNPFGDLLDGVPDAALVRALGMLAELGGLPQPEGRSVEATVLAWALEGATVHACTTTSVAYYKGDLGLALMVGHAGAIAGVPA